MGLPMFLSPPLSKRQLPPKQSESDLSADSSNSRTSAFGNRHFVHRNLSNSQLSYNNENDLSTFHQDLEANLTYPQHNLEIPEWQPIRTEIQRSEERRRRRSLPYNNLVQQHIQRLHQLHHLHRTREQMSSTSSSLAARRGLQAAHLMNLQAEQASQGPQIPLPALRSPVRLRPSDEHRSYHRRSHHDRSHRVQNDSDTSSLSSSVTDSSSSPISSPSTALDEVIRRVNLLRQMAQQERLLRPSYRFSNGSSRSPSSSSSSSPSSTSGLIREESTARFDFSPISVDNPTLVPTQNLGRLAPLLSSSSNLNSHRHHHHRHYTVALEQPPSNSSSFEADHRANFGLLTDNPARILSPIPRRYGSAYSNALAAVSGNSIDYDGEERDGYEVDPNGVLPGEPSLSQTTTNNEDGIPRVPIERGSASGECC